MLPLNIWVAAAALRRSLPHFHPTPAHLVDLVDASADASVHAQDLALDDGGQRQVVEQLVDAPPHEHARLVAQALKALQAEAEQRVDVVRLGWAKRAEGLTAVNGSCCCRSSCGCSVVHLSTVLLFKTRCRTGCDMLSPLPVPPQRTGLLETLPIRPHLVVAAYEVH